jgi:hypothetical protein
MPADGESSGGRPSNGSGGAKPIGGDSNLGGAIAEGGESSGGRLASGGGTGGSEGPLGGVNNGGEGPVAECKSALDCVSDEGFAAATCRAGECSACATGDEALAVRVSLAPKPVVYLLADASQSMFETGSGWWALLGDGVIAALETRDDALKLGFGTSRGTTADCVGLHDLVSPGEQHAASVRAAYESITAPTGLVDSPLPQAIQEATALLAPLALHTSVTLLIFSDGEGDFCDNGNPDCAFDATVSALQAAAAKGVFATLIAPGSQVFTGAELDVLAQAGVGERPNWDIGLAVGPYDGRLDGQCRTYEPWQAFRQSSGQAPPVSCTSDPLHVECHLPAGKYSEAGGSGRALVGADAAVQKVALGKQLDALTECTFVLSEAILVSEASKTRLLLDGKALDSTSWRIREPSTITLEPSACAKLAESSGELVLEARCGDLAP